jgi:hypothetical protein
MVIAGRVKATAFFPLCSGLRSANEITTSIILVKISQEEIVIANRVTIRNKPALQGKGLEALTGNRVTIRDIRGVALRAGSN